MLEQKSDGVCAMCGKGVCQEDNFCRHCGEALRARSLVKETETRMEMEGGIGCDGRVSRPAGVVGRRYAGRGYQCLSRFSLVTLLLMLMLAVVAVLAHPGGTSHSEQQGEEGSASSDLWRDVGELFNQEEIRQRELRHESADAVENGPKEISIHCPQNPTVRIVDLDEQERNRDECLVLHISAPDVSSRLVLYCSGTKENFSANTTFDSEEL